MPLIKVQTSVSAPEKAEIQTLLKGLSSSLAKHLGKPESYVMTAFNGDVEMTFAGTFEPVCYIEVKSVGTIRPEQTQSMSKDFCNKIHQAIGVPPNRIYIEFTDAEGSMWGWNGSTF